MSAIRALIFGGTSEGRELAEFASAHHAAVLVSVVSEYGESLLEENGYVRVRRGRLDSEAMEALMREEKPELVLDATHPYASMVTGQVETLCGKLGIPYRRVVREETAEHENTGCCGGNGLEADGDILRVPSPERAAELLAGDREPVLLTTGSKELEVFAAAKHLEGRIFARVLPDSKVLAKCEALGISGAHLIAMQGPFSEELNRAILRQTGAKWLVTKESGTRGGFLEKVQAARDCGCRIIVIDRPVKEWGISLAEAEELLRPGGKNRAETRIISLIGMGMGGGGQLTLESAAVLKECDAVMGAPRMLADVAAFCAQAKKEPLYLADRIMDWLEAHPEYRNVGVVYSGDTGFYSGSSSLLDEIKRRFGGSGYRENCGWQVQVYPGISSVSSLCARMHSTWEGMYLASAHGRECDVVELVRRHPFVFLLLGGGEDLGSICGKLAQAGYGDAQVTAGVRMGYPEERLVTGTASELGGTAVEELTAAVIQRKMRD